MRNFTLGLLATLAFVGLTLATPAMAVVDDGSGCGCIRPCFIKSQKETI